MAKILARIGALVALGTSCGLLRPAFVPPAGGVRKHAVPISAAVGAAATLAASPAFADSAIDVAAKNLATVSYPMIQSIDFTKASPIIKYMTTGQGANKAIISALLDCAVSMDSALITKAVAAHQKAIDAADSQLKTPLANHIEVVTALANMLASAPPAKVYAVFAATPNLNQLNTEWLGMMDPNVATKAYTAFLQTAQAVKR